MHGKYGHVLSVRCLSQSVGYKCGKRNHLQTVCKLVIKLIAVPDKAVKQVAPGTDSSSHGQLLKSKDGTDDLGMWTITGGVTQGYHVHLKVNHKLESWIQEQQCR